MGSEKEPMERKSLGQTKRILGEKITTDEAVSGGKEKPKILTKTERKALKDSVKDGAGKPRQSKKEFIAGLGSQGFEAQKAEPQEVEISTQDSTPSVVDKPVQEEAAKDAPANTDAEGNEPEITDQTETQIESSKPEETPVESGEVINETPESTEETDASKENDAKQVAIKTEPESLINEAALKPAEFIETVKLNTKKGRVTLVRSPKDREKTLQIVEGLVKTKDEEKMEICYFEGYKKDGTMQVSKVESIDGTSGLGAVTMKGKKKSAYNITILGWKQMPTPEVVIDEPTKGNDPTEENPTFLSGAEFVTKATKFVFSVKAGNGSVEITRHDDRYFINSEPITNKKEQIDSLKITEGDNKGKYPVVAIREKTSDDEFSLGAKLEILKTEAEKIKKDAAEKAKAELEEAAALEAVRKALEEISSNPETETPADDEPIKDEKEITYELKSVKDFFKTLPATGAKILKDGLIIEICRDQIGGQYKASGRDYTKKEITTMFCVNGNFQVVVDSPEVDVVKDPESAETPESELDNEEVLIDTEETQGDETNIPKTLEDVIDELARNQSYYTSFRDPSGIFYSADYGDPNTVTIEENKLSIKVLIEEEDTNESKFGFLTFTSYEEWQKWDNGCTYLANRQDVEQGIREAREAQEAQFKKAEGIIKDEISKQEPRDGKQPDLIAGWKLRDLALDEVKGQDIRAWLGHFGQIDVSFLKDLSKKGELRHGINRKKDEKKDKKKKESACFRIGGYEAWLSDIPDGQGEKLNFKTHDGKIQLTYVKISLDRREGQNSREKFILGYAPLEAPMEKFEKKFEVNGTIFTDVEVTEPEPRQRKGYITVEQAREILAQTDAQTIQDVKRIVGKLRGQGYSYEQINKNLLPIICSNLGLEYDKFQEISKAIRIVSNNLPDWSEVETVDVRAMSVKQVKEYIDTVQTELPELITDVEALAGNAPTLLELVNNNQVPQNIVDSILTKLGLDKKRFNPVTIALSRIKNYQYGALEELIMKA